MLLGEGEEGGRGLGGLLTKMTGYCGMGMLDCFGSAFV
jgi:hypothetical protein